MARIKLVTSIKDHGLYRNKANDISDWKDLGFEAGGAREKKILLQPSSGRQFLTKFPKYGNFEIVTEVFNSILARELGCNHTQYFPVIYKGRKGVACPSFLNHKNGVEELWEMKDLVCRHSKQANLSDMYGRDDDVLKAHNIENIYLILDSEFGMDVLPQLFQMIGLDALIGHGDRHWSNYGVVVRFVKDDLSAKFAPLYDTASGYLTEQTQRNRLESMLTGELQDEAWYMPKIKGLCKVTLPNSLKCNHFDLMQYILENSPLKKYKPHLSLAFQRFEEGLPRAILNKFFDDLEPLRKQAIETILISRYRIGKKLL